MAHQTLKGLMIIALAGTTLSGCSLVGSVADTAWGGTKTVAKWVSAPVRFVLRDTPDAETQFAGVETETEVAEADVETTEILVAEAEIIKAEPLSTTITTVSESRVVAAEPIVQSTQTSVTHSSSYQTTSAVRSSAVQMASAADFSSSSHYSIQTTNGTGNIHFVRLKGESNMADWMDCNSSANGYWITSASGGHINPAFEVCMRGMDYVLQTELNSYDTAEVVTETADLTVSPVKVSSIETSTMAGGVESQATHTTSASYVALPAAQSAALPDKF